MHDKQLCSKKSADTSYETGVIIMHNKQLWSKEIANNSCDNWC